jgi:hypothetical protein
MVHARSVVRHFFDKEKLKGFAGSVDEVQVMNVGSDFEAIGGICPSSASRFDGWSCFFSVVCELRLVEDLEVGVAEAMTKYGGQG